MTRRRLGLLLGLLAAVTVSCSSGPAKQVASSDPTGARAPASPAAGASVTGARTSTTFTATGSPIASPKTSTSAAPFVFTLSGTISPTCVRPGQQATIVVQTLTKAAVAYDTFYSDGRSGGTPPYGDGLGGNASGLTDEQGRYTNSWVVSAAAPAGKAYARVLAAYKNQEKEIRVPFAVSNALGDC